MTYTLIDLEKAVASSLSYSETLARLGKSKSTASYELLKRKIQDANLSITHFNVKFRKQNQFHTKKDWQEILIEIEDRTYRENAVRLRRALRESGRQYKCEDCQNEGTWNGKEIILEVDHKDGNWRNNKPDNLRLLCPNCHSQTENFYNQQQQSYCKCGNTKFSTSKSCLDCGRKKNRKVADRPTKEQLIQDFAQLTSYVQVGKKYGVSDKAIRKWVISYEITPAEINRNV